MGKTLDMIRAVVEELKSSQNKKDLYDVTAAPFGVFSQLPAAKYTPKSGQL